MRYVKEFEALRGVLAIWVVVGHVATASVLHGRLIEAKLYNFYAVTVFILLSGFAIAALIDKKPEGYGRYITRRAFRIFPVYLFYLALSVLLANFALETWLNAPAGVMQASRTKIATDTLTYWPWHLAAHLPALHGLVPPRLLPSTDYAFLGQAWSISLEWQYYLIAPFLIGVLTMKMNAIRIGLLLFGALAIAFVLPRMPESFIGGWLLDFTLGIATFTFMKYRDRATHPLRLIPIVKVWALVIVGLLLQRSVSVLPYLIWATVIMLVIRARETEGGVAALFSRVANARPLQWVGNMAYSVYLSHMIVLLVVLRAVQALGINEPWPQFAVLVTATLAGTLVISRLSYVFIELPFHQYGRNIGQRAQPIPAPANVPLGE
ncbi:acyltransferase [Pararhizobium sp. YC-54]|uniref:acyltransferase family protein n=1 Tax=Pararhizobium sp. YC-54 TaxID=2986920 RepID=UPI0021F7328F|nr:acyltransferase [Pararhizobium sp. YC-54]MCV9999964.1 acyltransferase [Pararhizobium sp. YC-54]